LPTTVNSCDKYIGRHGELAGLVSRVVPSEQLVDEAVKTAQQIASFSKPIGSCQKQISVIHNGEINHKQHHLFFYFFYFNLPVSMGKDCVNRAFETTLAEGVNYERRIFHSTFATVRQTESQHFQVDK
jgi:enoyl-CoA hydratase